MIFNNLHQIKVARVAKREEKGTLNHHKHHFQRQKYNISFKSARIFAKKCIYIFSHSFLRFYFFI